MGLKSFIKSVKDSFGIKNSKELSKRKAIKNILKKLNKKKEKLEKSSNRLKDTKDELKILSFQIKKGVKLLKKLEV